MSQQVRPRRVRRLSEQERNVLLPRTPTGQQYRALLTPSPSAALQSLAVSLLGLLLSQPVGTPLIVPASTFVAWKPVLQCMQRNAKARKAKFAALWLAHVLRRTVYDASAVPVDDSAQPEQSDSFPSDARSNNFMTVVTVGDASGFRIDIRVPNDGSHTAIVPGDAAVLTILSDSPGFYSFRALNEVFIPARQLFLSDYPFAERSTFISLAEQMLQQYHQDN